MSITIDLLNALLSPELEKRKHAEDYFQSLPVDERCGFLLQFLSTSNRSGSSNCPGDHHFLLAAVLLRRSILRLTNALLLQDMVVPLLNLFIISVGNYNSQSNIRRHVGHCLAAVCQTLSLLNHSSECDAAMKTIFNQILPMCTSDLDVPSIRLIAGLAEWAPSSFQRTRAVQFIPPLMQSATAFLVQNQTNENLLQALVDMLVFGAIATNSDDRINFQTAANTQPNETASQLGKSCLIPLLPYLATCCHGEGYAVLPSLQNLAHAAAFCPSFLAGEGDSDSRSLLVTVTDTFLSLAASDDLDADVRLSLLQILSSLYATPLVQQRMQRMNFEKDRFLSTLFHTCAKLMVNGIDDDVQSWVMEPASLSDKAGDLRWDQDRVADDAESLLESFLQSLGASQSFPVILNIVEQLLSSQGNDEWKYQITAISMLQCCLITAPRSFAPYLSMTVDKTIQLAARSNHPRVQYRALWLLGVVCELRLLETHASPVLQTVVHLVASQNCSKVTCMALDALASFCQGSTKENIVNFLQYVLPTLLSGTAQNSLQHQFHGLSVQIRTLRAIASWSAAAGEAMVPYYHQVMPALSQYIQPASNVNNNDITSYETMQLRSAAVEAASMMGFAVGQDHLELFLPDAQCLMQQILLPMLIMSSRSPYTKGDISTMDLKDDDDDLEWVGTACARIASVMGKNFQPYVEVVLPHLLQRATAPPNLEIEEEYEAGLDACRLGEVELDQDGGTESMTVALPGRGLTKVTVNISKMQNKALAARAVYEIAIALEADFIPFAPACLDAFLTLVDFPYSSDVRSTAAQTLGAVFQTTCSTGDQVVNTDVPKRYLPTLITAIAKQLREESSSNVDVLFNLADAMSEILYATYGKVKDSEGLAIVENFSFEHTQAVVQSLMGAMGSCLERRALILQQLSGIQPTGGEENADMSEQLRGEEQLLTALVDSIGYTLKLLRESFLPLFDGFVVPVLETYLVSQHPDARARHAAVCLWDDCIEHCGPEAVTRHAPQLAAAVVLAVNDATNAHDPDLKQAALYGLCQLARRAPVVLAPHVPSLLTLLLELCQTHVDSSNNVLVTNEYIVENAVSAIASMALIGKAPFAAVFTEVLPRESLIDIFLNNLPLTQDEDEAKICHAGLCEMVEQGQIPLIYHAHHLLRIISETLDLISSGDEVATPETRSQMVHILHQLQYNLPKNQVQDAFGALSVEAQGTIHEAMR